MNVVEHLLTCLAEEGGEVAKECCKILRFGLDDYCPYDPEQTPNRVRLVNELNDLLGVVLLLVEEGVLPEGWEDRGAQYKKMKKVVRHMGYAETAGALQTTGEVAR